MSLSNALFSGVSGLRANETMLDVVGNNLANSNTTGFKTKRVDFQDLLSQTLTPGSAPTDNLGGTNPMQVGFGVVVGSIGSDFHQGPLQPTGRELDLAIQGTGFFVVNDGVSNLYTRAGAFDLDEEGYLVDAASGFRVQRTGSVGEPTATTPIFQTVGDKDIKIPLGMGVLGSPTANVTLRNNLSPSLAIGESITTAIQVFDTQGAEHPLTLTFTKTAANSFSMDASLPDGTVAGVPVTGIGFNPDGTLASPASVTLSLSFPPGLPAAQPVTIHLGTTGQTDGLTQFGGESSAVAISQDGYQAGSLVRFSVDSDGIIRGVFSNGQILPMAQLAVAQFANAPGLLRVGDNMFRESGNSGEALIAPPLAGVSTIQAGSLEGSNVDVATEFTRLIIAQRGFQINARAVTASSEILQELANIIR